MPVSHDLSAAAVYRFNAESERYLAQDSDFWEQRALQRDYLREHPVTALNRFVLD
jgi:hypothetical protein